MYRNPHSFLTPVLSAVQRQLPPSDASDGDLLRHFSETKEVDAFEEILRRHGPMVLNVCLSLLNQKVDAEDAFQATFLVLARRAGSITKVGSLASWLYGVAWRVSTRLRSIGRSRRTEPLTELPASKPSPEAELAWKETHRLCLEELGKLPERFRDPLILCYLEGKSVETVAQLLGLPKGTLKGRLERARHLLRNRLVRRGLGPSVYVLVLAGIGAEGAKVVSAELQRVTATLAVAGGMNLPSSPFVFTLAQGVIQTMWWTKVKIALASTVVAVTLTFGCIWVILPASNLAVLAAQSPQATTQDKKPVASETNAGERPEKGSAGTPQGTKPATDGAGSVDLLNPRAEGQGGAPIPPKKVVTISLKFVKASEAVDTLAKIALQTKLDLRITTIERTNAILVEGDARSVESATALLAILDVQVPPPAKSPPPPNANSPSRKNDWPDPHTDLLTQQQSLDLQELEVQLAEIEVEKISVAIRFLKDASNPQDLNLRRTLALKELDLRKAMVEVRRQELIRNQMRTRLQRLQEAIPHQRTTKP